jgi:hypothetical protein
MLSGAVNNVRVEITLGPHSAVRRSLNWGISSFDRATALHAVGDRFESDILHQNTILKLLKRLRKMSSVRINGVTISGNDILVKHGSVFVDGKVVDTGDSKQIRIEVDGSIERLNVDACDSITVSGSAGSVSTRSGDVTCGNVEGAVSTMSGDVRCGNIGGSVSTISGDIIRK